MNNVNEDFVTVVEDKVTRKTIEVDYNLVVVADAEDKDTPVEPIETNKVVGINEIETIEVTLDDDIEVAEKAVKDDKVKIDIDTDNNIVETKVFDNFVHVHYVDDVY